MLMNKNANIYCSDCEIDKDYADCKLTGKGQPMCPICSEAMYVSASCCDCDKTLEKNEWIEESNDDIYCDDCNRNKTVMDWIESTEKQVRKLCESNGWDMPAICSGGFNTNSRYYELTKTCGLCASGADDLSDCDCQTIKLRISDHGSCYCSEDISLAMNSSGDDHTIEHFDSVLKRA